SVFAAIMCDCVLNKGKRPRRAFHRVAGMAEGVGFEPTVEVLPLQRISSALPSASRPPFLGVSVSGLLRASVRPSGAASTPPEPQAPSFGPMRVLVYHERFCTVNEKEF